MKNIQNLETRFIHQKSQNCVSFAAYIGDNNSSFTQSGDLRSDYAWKEFDNKKQFVKAIEKYLSNPYASISRVVLNNEFLGDSPFASFDSGREFVLKMILEELKVN
jgi:hypothetical protein